MAGLLPLLVLGLTTYVWAAHQDQKRAAACADVLLGVASSAETTWYALPFCHAEDLPVGELAVGDLSQLAEVHRVSFSGGWDPMHTTTVRYAAREGQSPVAVTVTVSTPLWARLTRVQELTVTPAG